VSTQESAEAGPDAGDRVSLRIRLFVGAFLAAFVVAGFFGIEAWPLTGWRLFSALRHDRTEGWSAVTVDSAGGETAIPFGALGAGFGWATNILTAFPKLPAARQAGICDAWAVAVRGRGGEVVAIRIYRIVRYVGDRSGDRGAPVASRTLRYTCAGGSVRAEELAGAPA
jgi:hypothetical protein